MTENEKTEVKTMLMEVTCAAAMRCVNAVRDGGLQVGQVAEVVDVLGQSWHLTVKYASESDSVVIEGHPESDHVAMHPLAALITGQAPGAQSDEEAPVAERFIYSMPTAWLEKIAGV
jgi:hypothetical protein